MYTDWLGQEIKVGTHILYAISSSHYAKLVYGEVLEIIPIDVSKQRHVWYGRDFKLKVQPYFENTDVISGTDRGSEYVPSKDGASKFVRKNPKPVTLQNIEKVTVFSISDEMLSKIDQDFEDRLAKRNEKLLEQHKERVGS